MNRKTLLVAVIFAMVSAVCQAWEDSGHMLIGEIAARKLRPEVIKKMNALIPLLDTRYNEGFPYNLITAGVWLDDQRKLGKANPWSRWHYIDVPCEGDAFEVPAPPHAIWALDQAVPILVSKTAEPKARAEALAQIMHIVGDIHQPLHTATRDDLGGNSVLIAPLIRSDAGPTNLHAFWDGAFRFDVKEEIITELWKAPNHTERPHSVGDPGDIAEKALAFMEKISPPPTSSPAAKQPWHAWTRETHAIACKSGWPPESGLSLSTVRLTPEFVHESHDIAVQQIVKAGYRLAELLNELLGDEPETKQSGTQEVRK